MARKKTKLEVFKEDLSEVINDTIEELDEDTIEEQEEEEVEELEEDEEVEESSFSNGDKVRIIKSDLNQLNGSEGIVTRFVRDLALVSIKSKKVLISSKHLKKV